MENNLKSNLYEQIITEAGGTVDDLPDHLESTYMNRLLETVKGGGSSGSGNEGNVLNSSYWDIKKILDEDTVDYPGKAIYLLRDTIDQSTYYSKAVAYRTSDNPSQVIVGWGEDKSYIWDKTKDKPAYLGDTPLEYSTRWVILYFDNIEQAIHFNLMYDRYCIMEYFKGITKIITGVYNYNTSSNILKLSIGDKQLIPVYSDGTTKQIVFNSYNCELLPSILIESNVTYNEFSFGECKNISKICDKDMTIRANRISISYCNNLKELPIISLSRINNNGFSISSCDGIEELILVDFMRIVSSSYIIMSCKQLKKVKTIDLSSRNSSVTVCYNCPSITDLTIINISHDLQIGSGTSWGHLLTVDSLVNTCKECIKKSASRTLTVGSANLEKLASLYVKFVDPSQTEIAVGEKGDVVVCESTDEGAMLIENYMLLKDWTLA